MKQDREGTGCDQKNFSQPNHERLHFSRQKRENNYINIKI